MKGIKFVIFIFSLTQFLVTIYTETSLVNQTNLIQQFCTNTNLTIDSSISPIDTDIVFLFTKDLFIKLKFKSEDIVSIESANRLSFWNEKVIPPIDMVSMDSDFPDLIKLINCKDKKEWLINYKDNRYESSRTTSECQESNEPNEKFKTIEILIARENPGDLRLEKYWVQDWYEIGIRILRTIFLYFLRMKPTITPNDKSYSIRLVDEYQGHLLNTTKPFVELKGSRITAAFIYNKSWYLFGGRYLCKTLLKFFDDMFTECTPIVITDWVDNCPKIDNGSTIVPSESPNEVVSTDEDKQNKDISLMVITIVVITAIALIIIIALVLLIYREVSKQKTSTLQTYH